MHVVLSHYPEYFTQHANSAAQVYYTQPDHNAYLRTAKDPDDVVAHLKGLTNCWAYEQCQTVHERMTLRVPGAACNSANTQPPQATHADVAVDKEWLWNLTLNAEHDLVFVAVQLSVYAFSLEDGTRLFDWEVLHKQPVTHVRLSRA